jgi:hypothetical protein
MRNSVKAWKPATTVKTGIMNAVTTVLFILLIASCGGKLPQMAKKSELTPADMSAVKAQGLYGNVKTVKYSNILLGEEQYNKSGELTKRSTSEAKYKYAGNTYTQTEYSTMHYTITFGPRSRIDREKGYAKSGWDYETKTYEFDDYGRVVLSKYHNVTSQFIYDGADAFPSSEEYTDVTYVDDENNEEEVREVVVKRTMKYEYLEIDAHNNWIKRASKVKCDGEEDFGHDGVETRTITYYEEGDIFTKGIPRKFPCDIPFKTPKGLGYWEIESIECTGKTEGKDSYDFVIHGIGVKNSRGRSMMDNSITIIAEDNNTGKGGTGAYFLPGRNTGEEFNTKFVHWIDDDFTGFIILPQ